MWHGGNYYINAHQTAKVLGISMDSFFQKRVKEKHLTGLRTLETLDGRMYCQEDVYKRASEYAKKEQFLKSVQACTLLVLSDSGDKKIEVSEKLGFGNIGSLEAFLSADSYSNNAARTLVKIWFNYRSILRRYDNGDF